jgi:hypothetical protein
LNLPIPSGDELLKRYGLKAVAGIALACVIAFAVWKHYWRLVERSALPAILVVNVTGATEPLRLVVDNRDSNAPRSTFFFRVDGVAPGDHLLELFSESKAVYTKVTSVSGGTENQIKIDLNKVPKLPDLGGGKSLPDGWILLSADHASVDEGQSLTLTAPAFVRDTPGSIGQHVMPGVAFATYSAGETVEVSELWRHDKGDWIKVHPVDRKEE